MGNRKWDYEALEKQFVFGDMSLRVLCSENGIEHASGVISYAKRHAWAEKREQYRNRSKALTIEKVADREASRAVREMEVRDNAIEAINEAIDKMRADMRATKKTLVNNEWVEEPVMRIGPKDLAILIDRMNVLFGRPSTISEERNLGLAFSAEGLPPEFLRTLVDATSAVGKPSAGPSGGTALPRAEGGRKN